MNNARRRVRARRTGCDDVTLVVLKQQECETSYAMWLDGYEKKSPHTEPHFPQIERCQADDWRVVA